MGFLDLLKGIGPLLGIGKGIADSNFQQGELQNGFNNSQVNAAGQNLNQQKFLADVPSTYASQAARGGLQANAQDASITGVPSYIHVPTISGGLRPSALGPTSQAAGATLSKQALMKLLNPQPYDPLKLTSPV